MLLLASAAADSALSGRCRLRQAVWESAWIFLIFFVYAASPPPDAGESHYLVKARHYWEPAWCESDLFLQSYDTHLGFYWALGWVTKLASLTAATWILRGVLWLALAIAWQRLSWAVVPVPLLSLLSAGLMLLLAEHFHWAKEIILRGGVEGKTAAYVCVLVALERVARDRWTTGLVWTGVAGAFHVLVGGWAAVATSLAWLALGRRSAPWPRMALAAAATVVAALPGLLPSLRLVVSPDVPQAAEAYRIYVFERLAHHLVFHEFPLIYQVRHALLAVVWAALAWRLWPEGPQRRVAGVVGGAVAIGLTGIALDQMLVIRSYLLGQSAEAYELSAAPWLRFYWYRLEDALLPIGTALAAVGGLVVLRRARPHFGEWVLIGAILAATANVSAAWYRRTQLRIPGAVVQQQATADLRQPWGQRAPRRRPTDSAAPATGHRVDLAVLTAPEHYAWWRAACAWIAENTPADARFLTPRRQQTFKWHAGRAEVATWKDIPQDPASILAWYAAILELYPHTEAHRRYDLAAFSDEKLVELARKYDSRYIVIERRPGARRIGLPRVYPAGDETNPVFEVYRVPP